MYVGLGFNIKYERGIHVPSAEGFHKLFYRISWFFSYHIVVWRSWSGSVVDDVELSDEKGVVKHLREFPYDYGIDHLKERETLILLKVDGTITLIT